MKIRDISVSIRGQNMICIWHPVKLFKTIDRSSLLCFGPQIKNKEHNFL